MDTTRQIYALYFAADRNAETWRCMDQRLLTEKEVEDLLACYEALIARACRVLGICTLPVYVRVVECWAGWNPAAHGRVDKLFFREEPAQIIETRAIEPRNERPRAPAPAAPQECPRCRRVHEGVAAAVASA